MESDTRIRIIIHQLCDQCETIITKYLLSLEWNIVQYKWYEHVDRSPFVCCFSGLLQ